MPDGSETVWIYRYLLAGLCLMVPVHLENPVHGLRDLVYEDNDYDVRGQEKGAYFGRWGDPVHGMGGLVYGTGFQDSAVHGMGDLVYSLLSEKATLS